jgi:hypothetical protein
MSSARSILLIYDCMYPVSLGGVEYRNYCLARALAERGHRVSLAGWGDVPPASLPPGVTLVRLPHAVRLHDRDGKRGIVPTLRFTAAMLWLDLSPYDIVETANIPYLHVFPLAVRCWLARKPLVVSWYEFFGPYWRRYKGGLTAPLFRGIEWLVAQLGDRVNASCEQTRLKLAAARRSCPAASGWPTCSGCSGDRPSQPRSCSMPAGSSRRSGSISCSGPSRFCRRLRRA